MYMISRIKDNAVYQSEEELDIPDDCDDGVIKDEIKTVGEEQKLRLRRMSYRIRKRRKYSCL